MRERREGTLLLGLMYGILSSTFSTAFIRGISIPNGYSREKSGLFIIFVALLPTLTAAGDDSSLLTREKGPL